MFNPNCNCNHNFDNNFKTYPDWNTLCYYNETTLPKPIDKLAGSWPLYFFCRNNANEFYTHDSKLINFNLKNPNLIDFDKELNEIIQMQDDSNNNPNSNHIETANFWGSGVPINQWTPIALQLISSYKVTAPKSARIMSSLHALINDAFVITWYYKYLYNAPRPCQLDHNLKTILNTPRFPSYPSGHSVVSGACEVLLSYYFPAEAEKLHILAQDASISRLYGCIHFRSDLEEGLKLGRQIGSIAIHALKYDKDKMFNYVDYIYTNFADAPIMPPYYNKK